MVIPKETGISYKSASVNVISYFIIPTLLTALEVTGKEFQPGNFE